MRSRPLTASRHNCEEGLWGLAIDRDRVLAEWLRAIGGRVPARVLTSSSSFQYLIAAAPGAREMITMVKLWELAQGRRLGNGQPTGERGRSSIGRGHCRKRAGGERDHERARREREKGAGGSAEDERDYDLVVFDAPATGHALAMLRSPHTFGTIARVGPIARQSGHVRELLEDPARTAYLAVRRPPRWASPRRSSCARSAPRSGRGAGCGYRERRPAATLRGGGAATHRRVGGPTHRRSGDTGE